MVYGFVVINLALYEMIRWCSDWEYSK